MSRDTQGPRRIRLGKGGSRREHVRAFAQRVEIADDAIYTKGKINALSRTLMATKSGNRRSRFYIEVAEGKIPGPNVLV